MDLRSLSKEALLRLPGCDESLAQKIKNHHSAITNPNDLVKFFMVSEQKAISMMGGFGKLNS